MIVAEAGLGEIAVGALVVCACLLVYFVPALVASGRQHPNSSAIFILNLFLGWTFLGWVVALVWASTAVSNRGDN